MARKYDREFKLAAIRLATEDGAQATDIERLLGLRICQEISASFGFSSLRSNGIVPLAVEGVPL